MVASALADIRRENRRRHRTFDAPSLPGLLPGVRQDADASAEHEETARKWRRKPEFGIDDGRRPVDVHRHRLAHGAVQCGFDRASGANVVPVDDALLNRIVHERKQRFAAWVDRVEPVPESGQVWGPGPPVLHDLVCGCVERPSRGFACRDLVQQFHTLLACATMDVAEKVDADGDRTVEPRLRPSGPQLSTVPAARDRRLRPAPLRAAQHAADRGDLRAAASR